MASKKKEEEKIVSEEQTVQETEQVVVESSVTEKQLVVFKIDQEEFGVEINEVKEINKIEEITKIPNTESYVEGVINLRGRIIVVIDLAKRLNLTQSKRTKDSRIIVTEIGNSTIGMIVDECNEVLRLHGDEVKAAPDIVSKKIDNEFIEGVGVKDDRLIILLKLSKIITESEVDKLQHTSGSAAQSSEKQ